MPLTLKLIEKLEKGKHLDAAGLYLHIRSPSRKAWEYRYQVGDVERRMGLGSLSDISLQEARDLAASARKAVREGRDPILERRVAKQMVREQAAKQLAKAKTFKDAAREYFEQHHLKWKNRKHRAQFLSTLEQYAYPVFGNTPVADIDRPLVLKVLDPIWTVKTETASRVRRRIENVLGFASIRGYRSGDNPATWVGNLALVFPERGQIRKPVHHRALSFSAVPLFIAALRKRECMAAKALEFLILTATRTAEVIGAKWQEIDLEQRAWTIPAERMKAGREHRVPLSGAAIALLKTLPREGGNPYVFLGPRKHGLSGMAMTNVLKRMGHSELATVHGFRSSFRDWSAEKTNYQNHVAEAALAHTVGDKVEAAYRRGDLFEKRRHLMEDWGRYCEAKAGSALEAA